MELYFILCTQSITAGILWVSEMICALTSGVIHLFTEKKKMEANLIK